jgi:D-alanyl-D-alanine carboxypeptidase (penicillin-binding protein 5/6)
MRVIDPRRFERSQALRKQRARHKKTLLSFGFLLILIAGYAGYCLKRPLPALQPVRTAQISVPSRDVRLSWPADGQTALGAANYGLLATSGSETPKPIASIAKVMTALAVLKKFPLELGQNGQSITVTQADIDNYNDYIKKEGSVVAVNLGQQLTQYQALQGLLIPSGNNIADLLVRWAFGSMESYLAYANNLAQDMGLSHTKISDASGFSPQTTSTPSDLVKLGLAALDHPVIADIVKQRTAQLPGAGTIYSTNVYLGKGNVIGIKTGHTDESGGCFLLGATHDFGGRKATVVVATLGAKDVNAAMSGTVNMLPTILAGFGEQPVLTSGELVGHYNVPWQGQVNIIARSDMKVFGWLGSTLQPTVSLSNQNVPASQGAEAGSITLKSNGQQFEAKAETSTGIIAPSVWWRLTHPY